MENFVKVSAEVVNGKAVINEKLMPRSLVLINAKTGNVWNVAAKCRNTDKISVCKALAKVVLAAALEKAKQNGTTAAMESKKKVYDDVPKALGCHRVYVTDKDGKILEKSGVFTPADNFDELVPLRKLFRFTKAMPIYKLVVEDGKDWSDESVINALKWWCTATVEQLDYVKRLDEAIGAAADSNEKEAKAEEAKEAEKTAEKEEKSAA